MSGFYMITASVLKELKVAVLKNFAIFAENYASRSLLLIKLQHVESEVMTKLLL